MAIGRGSRLKLEGDTPVAIFLAAAVLLSAILVGGVHTVTMLLVGAITVAGMWFVRRLDRQLEDPRIGTPALLMLALSAYTLVQTIPMPISALATLAPANADVWERALLPFGETVATGSISLDPGASLREALKGCIYAGLFLTASALATRRGGEWGIAIVFVSALAVALITVGHNLVGAEAVYGLYEPSHKTSATRVGPFINPNNLAGYLNLGGLCGMGLLFMRRPLIPTWAIGLGIAIIEAVAVMGASRGGVAVMPVGLVIFGGLLFVVRRRSLRRKHLILPAAVMTGSVVFGVALALMGGDQADWRELADENLQKLQLVNWSKPLLSDFGFFGIGRGAFESVFAAYRPGPGPNVVYTHPENIPVQWASEWGMPIGLLALAGFAWMFRPVRMGVHRSAVAAGAWAGVFIVVLQNMVDLGFELLGLAAAVAVVLGSIWGDRARAPRAKNVPKVLNFVRTSRLAYGVAGAIAITGLAAALWGWNDIAITRQHLNDHFAQLDVKDETARAEYRDELRTAMLQHPADPYPPLMGATLAWSAGDQSPMPWIQRSLERSPVNGRAHLLLAGIFIKSGAKRQALLEMRLAVESEPNLAPNAAVLAARQVQSFEDVLAAAPGGKAGARFLTYVADQLNKPEQNELQVACDTEALKRDPALLQPALRLSSRTLGGLNDPNICPVRSECEAEIERLAGLLASHHSQTTFSAQIQARLLHEQEKTTEALTLLNEQCTALRKDRAACLQLQIQLAAKAAPASLTDLLGDYQQHECSSGSRDRCVTANVWLGNYRTSRNEWPMAVSFFQRAAKLDRSETNWVRLADTAERADMLPTAIEALKDAQRSRDTPSPAIAKRIAALELKATKILMNRRAP